MNEIQYIKYFNESGSINFTAPRESDSLLPAVRDMISFGSPRRYMVTKTEIRGNTLWVWLGDG